MAKFDKIAVLNKIGSTGMEVEFVLLSLPIGGTLPRKYLPGL